MLVAAVRNVVGGAARLAASLAAKTTLRTVAAATAALGTNAAVVAQNAAFRSFSHARDATALAALTIAKGGIEAASEAAHGGGVALVDLVEGAAKAAEIPLSASAGLAVTMFPGLASGGSVFNPNIHGSGGQHISPGQPPKPNG